MSRQWHGCRIPLRTTGLQNRANHNSPLEACFAFADWAFTVCLSRVSRAEAKEGGDHMKPSAFHFERPDDLQAALALLATCGDAHILSLIHI